jgi:hypothetical protein
VDTNTRHLAMKLISINKFSAMQDVVAAFQRQRDLKTQRKATVNQVQNWAQKCVFMTSKLVQDVAEDVWCLASPGIKAVMLPSIDESDDEIEDVQGIGDVHWDINLIIIKGLMVPGDPALKQFMCHLKAALTMGP